ncbi:hypothetical protein [Actinophytocola sediminis]
MSENHFAADPDEVSHGGRAFGELGLEIAGIDRDLNAAVMSYGQRGSGEMGEALEANYRPGEEVAVQFLELFHNLFIEKGNRLWQTGRSLSDTDEEATFVANRPDSPDQG